MDAVYTVVYCWIYSWFYGINMQDATLVAKSLVAQLIGTSLVFPKETSRVQISAPLLSYYQKKKNFN